jgi:hypothetical protein
MAKNLKAKKSGYVYMLENTESADIIKIGEAADAEARANTLSSQTGAFGTFSVIWKHKVDDDNQAVERALQYKFREFSVSKEYFRINKKTAIRIASQFVKDIKPLRNLKAKQYQSLKSQPNKPRYKKASKSLWSEIIKSNERPFVREAIALCLKEGKLGQPQYHRISAIRNHHFTHIGRVDMYFLREKLRLVVTTTKAVYAVKRIIKEKIGKQVEITTWEGGVSFFVKDIKEFKALKKWFVLGRRPSPYILL